MRKITKLKIPAYQSYPARVEVKDWLDNVYYSKNVLVKSAFLQRFQKSLDMIAQHRLHKVLEVGTGIGFFLPSLAKIADHVFAVDIEMLPEVKEMCRREGLYDKCSLVKCDVRHLAFEDNYFDLIVCLSVLEHVRDIEKASEELYRVLNHSGTLIIGYPIDKIATRLGQRIFVKSNVKDFHIHEFYEIRKIANRLFLVVAEARLPFRLPSFLSIYEIIKCKKSKG